MCSGSESQCTLFSRLVDSHRSLWWNCNSRCSCRNWLWHPLESWPMGSTLLSWARPNRVHYYKEAWACRNLFVHWQIWSANASRCFVLSRPYLKYFPGVRLLKNSTSSPIHGGGGGGGPPPQRHPPPRRTAKLPPPVLETVYKVQLLNRVTLLNIELGKVVTFSLSWCMPLEWLRCKENICNLSIHISNRVHLFFLATILGIFTHLYYFR